jgi:hypothetical protein
LHAEFRGVGVDRLGTGGCGDVRIAGGVDHRVGQHDAAAVGRGDDRAQHAIVLDERTAADRAEPQLGAGVQQLPPIPLGSLLDDPAGFAVLDGRGEANPVAPIVAGDRALGADSAQSVQVFDHQGLGALSSRPDPGRSPAGAAADDQHVVAAEHGQAAQRLLHAGAVLVDRPDAGQEFAHFAFGHRPAGRLANQCCAARRGQRLGISRRGLADPVAHVDQVQRPQQPLGLLAGNIRTAAQDVDPVHARRLHRGQRQLVRARPRAGRRGAALHRVGRHLEQFVGRELLLGMIGQRAGLLVGPHQRGVAVVLDVQRQRVLDHREFAAGRAGRVRVGAEERLADDPCRPEVQFLGLPADHDAFERVRAAGIRPEFRAGQAGDGRARRGVDNRLGQHRLPSGPVGHDDAARLAVGVAEHVGRHAAIQELDSGVQQRAVQRFLDVHRTRRRAGALGGFHDRLVGRDDFDFAQQHAFVAFGPFHEEPHVARRLVDLGRQGRHVFARQVVDEHGRWIPVLPVVADRDGDFPDVEAAAFRAVQRAPVEDDADFADLLRLAQIGHDVYVLIELDALVGCAAPAAVGQQARRLGIPVDRRAGRVGFVGERDAVRIGTGRGFIAEDRPSQRCRRDFARFQPQPQRGRHVVAQVGIRCGEEHAGPLLGRGHRRRDGAGAAADDHHIDLVGHRDLARRFVDLVRGASGRGQGRQQDETEGKCGNSSDHQGFSLFGWDRSRLAFLQKYADYTTCDRRKPSPAPVR